MPRTRSSGGIPGGLISAFQLVHRPYLRQHDLCDAGVCEGQERVLFHVRYTHSHPHPGAGQPLDYIAAVLDGEAGLLRIEDQEVRLADYTLYLRDRFTAMEVAMSQFEGTAQYLTGLFAQQDSN